MPIFTDSSVKNNKYNIVNNIITYQYKLQIYSDINYISNPMMGSVIIETKLESYIGNGWCTDLVKYYRKVPWSGHAIDWWKNAKDYEYNTGQEPKVNAIMVEKTKYIYGHVALVTSVDNNNRTFDIIEQNMEGRGIVSERTLSFDYPFIMGFIY